MREDGSRGGGGIRGGDDARASTGGARTSGEGGHRAPGFNGAARTSVNRDSETAQFNRPATGSTTTRHLDRGAGDGRIHDLETGYLGRRVLPCTADTSISGAAVAPVLHRLPPLALTRHASTLSFCPCAAVWYLPELRTTWPASMAGGDYLH